MNRPRNWLGGMSIASVLALVTVLFVAWDRFDKMIDSRDAWRDRATKLEWEVVQLTQRASAEDLRNRSEDAWRRNAEKRDNYMINAISMVMRRLGLKPDIGPYQEAVPQPVTRLTAPTSPPPFTPVPLPYLGPLIPTAFAAENP